MRGLRRPHSTSLVLSSSQLSASQPSLQARACARAACACLCATADQMLYPAGSMPASLTLTGLFEAAGDPVELILAQTSPKTLAALAASCSSLHAVVARQPESVWQAAARAGYSASHPARRAADVRQYLQLQHTVAANISSGIHSRVELGAGLGSPCPDLLRHAYLDQDGADLVISELRTGQIVHRWAVPSCAASGCSRHCLHWDASGRYLACCGRAAWQTPDCLAIVEVLTGECRAVSLPRPGAASYVKWSAPSDRPSTLHVLVGESTYCVFSAEGSLIHSVPVPGSREEACPFFRWAPGTSLLACIRSGATQASDPVLWLLHMGSGQAAQPALLQSPARWDWLTDAWDPLSPRLLLGGQACSPDFQLISPNMQLAVRHTSPMPATHRCTGLCWGEAIAILCSPRQHGTSLLLLVVPGPGNELVLTHDLTPALEQQGCQPLAIYSKMRASPDGRYFTVAYHSHEHVQAGAKDCDAVRYALIVVSFSGSTLSKLDVPFYPFWIEWSVDGSKLLVSERCWTQHLVLDFV